MSKAFSVFVDIGGRVNPSLGASVSAAKAQVKGLEATLAGIGARINAPFIAAQKHLAETSKRLAGAQRKGRDLSLTATAPTGLFAVSAVKAATERAKAANELEAIGEIPHDQRKEVERFADSISAKYGDATGILKTFNELLKAGFDVASAKGSLPSILAGSAVAGDMTGAELGGHVSKIVTQFKLGMGSVEQAAASSRRVLDNLVFSAVKTTASTKDMAEGFKFVGSAAAAAGESIESTNAMLMALAKEGQLGSEAGVALRSAYVRLVKPTKGGLATLARLGLNYGDYVQGSKRSGAGVAAGLSAAGFDVTGKEKNIDKVLSANEGNPEKQRKAIFDIVAAKYGAQTAKDREAVLGAVDSAFALAGNKVDLVKLLTDLRARGANQGDLAHIFEGRQSVRMLALLKSDLNALLKEIQEGAPGFGDKTFDKTYQGLPKAVLQLDAAWKRFRNTLVEAVTPQITGTAERLANAVQSLADTNPGILKLGVGLTVAAAAAGPLMFTLGALGRIAAFALRGLVGGFALLLAPIGLVARGIAAIGTVLAGAFVAGAARLSAMAIGFRMLTALGAGATFSALGGSLLALGRSILLFPVTALRAIGMAMLALVANPVGLIIGGIVVGLTALGVWVANNWKGIKEFFVGFGDGFMGGIGSGGEATQKLANALGSVVNWLRELLGPLNATNLEWRSWGATLGGVVASGVNLVISGISKLIGFLGTVVNKAIAAGSAIKGMFTSGGAAPAPLPAPLAGARALGGPVSYGKPYLVGERGPELFVPSASGRIETNNTLRRLTSDGAAAISATESRSVHSGAIIFSPVFNISGDDPRGIGDQVRTEMRYFLAELEAQQRGLLSD